MVIMKFIKLKIDISHTHGINLYSYVLIWIICASENNNFVLSMQFEYDLASKVRRKKCRQIYILKLILNPVNQREEIKVMMGRQKRSHYLMTQAISGERHLELDNVTNTNKLLPIYLVYDISVLQLPYLRRSKAPTIKLKKKNLAVYYESDLELPKIRRRKEGMLYLLT